MAARQPFSRRWAAREQRAAVPQHQNPVPGTPAFHTECQFSGVNAGLPRFPAARRRDRSATAYVE